MACSPLGYVTACVAGIRPIRFEIRFERKNDSQVNSLWAYTYKMRTEYTVKLQLGCIIRIHIPRKQTSLHISAYRTLNKHEKEGENTETHYLNKWLVLIKI